MEDKDWMSKLPDSKTHRTSNWVRIVDEVTSDIGLIPSVGLILCISQKSNGIGVLRWAEISTL